MPFAKKVISGGISKDDIDKINKGIEDRFNALTSSQQQSSEVIDARDGETSLKARLDRDIEKVKQVYVNVEGSNISTDSSSGYAKDVEILGNTIQSASNLADIRSVGDKVEGQELYEIPVLSTNENLFNIQDYVKGGFYDSEGFKTNANSYYNNKFIRVSPSTTYHYLKKDSSPVTISYTVFYDANKNVIKSEYDKTQITTTPTTKYIRVSPWSNVMEGVENPFGYIGEKQLYEPYQEDKLTILSPVQLEKVGDVADRIIEKDGVWGVEKNVKTIYTKEFYSKNFSYENKADTFLWKLTVDTMTTNLVTNFMQSGKLSTESSQTQAMIYDHTSHRELRLAFKKSDFPNFNIESNVKEYLSDVNRYIKIVQSPTFIPLPHDQQVKLRTFADKTNISFLTEIEGTIKAQVPTSLGATVNTHTEQINNLNKELDRVKKLEESTVSTVTTESDFTTVEATSNGYFEDVKLEGKTLVNLSNLPSGDITLNNRVGNAHITPLKQLTSSDTLYLTFNCTSINSDSALGIIYSVSYKDDTPTEYKEIESDKTVGCKKVKIIPKSDIQHISIYLHSDNSSSASATISDVMLMYEKDYDAQNPPSYFEGLKSVGQSATTSEDGVDEIVVSSVNASGNLFDGELELGDINATTGQNQNSTVHTRGRGYTCVHPSKTIVTNTPCNIYEYNYKKEYIKRSVNVTGKLVLDSNTRYIRVLIANFTDLSIDFGVYYDEVTDLLHQSDKKRLLYYNNETQTWEKPILRQWDSIEKHADGKYYYHQRSAEVVLNGSEKGWGGTGNTFEDVIECSCSSVNIGKLNHICDKLQKGRTANSFKSATNGDIVIRLSKSILSTPNTEGFKQWLQTNNVTVVYQLAQEKVYECTNIDLITYANETNYIVESGAIVPRTTLKVHNNISNIVRELQIKVSTLEGYIQYVMLDALKNALNE